MMRTVKTLLIVAAIALVFAGVAVAANRPVPENQAQAPVQNTLKSELPGDNSSLEKALLVESTVKYKILVIDSTDGEDKTAYLDRVAESWGQPKADTLLLVVFTQDNYDLRFFMGANFRTQNVSVDEMLKLVRGSYFAKSQKGNVAGGLADLITAVNARMAAK